MTPKADHRVTTDRLASLLYENYVRGAHMTPKWGEQPAHVRALWREEASQALSEADSSDDEATQGGRDLLAELHDEQCAHGSTLREVDRLRAKVQTLEIALNESEIQMQEVLDER